MMTKAELIKRLENVKDDDKITFALFDYSDKRGYYWRELELSMNQDRHSASVIGLTKSIFTSETIEGLME